MNRQAAMQTQGVGKATPAPSGILQRAAINSSPVQDVPSVVHEVLRSPGQPVDAATHAFMEPRFGREFAQVPVHTAGAIHTSGAGLPFLETIQKSFGHHDVSNIRAHAGKRAAEEAWAIGAEAFARGSDVTFSRSPSLHTAAHEAAHVVQQRAGVEVAEGIGQAGDIFERHADEVADRVVRGQPSQDLLDRPPGFMSQNRTLAPHPAVIQMRRIPPNVRALLTAVGGGKGANFFANEEGALRLIELAMGELTPAERAKVTTRRLAGLTEAQFNALPRLERRSRFAEAILAEFPGLTLGDPKLIDTGPRPATADAANITKVVNHADNIFNDIASGARDSWLEDVFGSSSVAAAKARYKEGRTWMNTLHASDHIVTDRSGYSGEVGQGGLTGFQEIIRVKPGVIDNPDKNDSVVTLIHESMHAGNNDVSDDVYNGAPGFQTQPEAKKLLNAAHFEVVPWRILDPKDPQGYPVLPAPPPPAPPTFQKFIPAGTTVGGVTAPARTKAEEGAVAAYEPMRDAWSIGLNINLAYAHLFRKPTDWTVPLPEFGGKRLDKALPFWSKVQKLTIHMKTVIDPASPDEAKHPVSQIDFALAEGLTRRLAFGMDLLHPLDADAKIFPFETAHSTPSERAAAFPGGAHTNADAERDFLLRLAVRDPTVGPLTGSVERDLRVVRKQGDPSLQLMADIFAPRDPASFPG